MHFKLSFWFIQIRGNVYINNTLRLTKIHNLHETSQGISNWTIS